MSNLKVAVDFVLRQEDATLEGNVTTLRGDSGGATRFGLASASHPELVAQGYYDVTRVGRDAALAIAEKAYAAIYAEPLKIAQITDQAVATAVLSFGVNAGTRRPAEYIQQACRALGHPLVIDENIGTETLEAINSLDPDKLLAAFSSIVDGFYRELAAQTPEDARFLSGWENRVAAWTKEASALREQAKAV